jgi:2-methylisocitrate lyase-like PEP mutase family enzyme
MATQLERAEKFRALHARAGAFIIPNPWDAGSARMLSALGFEALATTSAGYAFSIGRLDGMVAQAEVIAHCRALCAATDLPVSADLENCFADDPKQAANTILLAAEAGVVGGSIEDYSNDDSRPIYDFALAVERVHAAVEAARSLDFPFTLTARAENLLRGRNDLDDTIRRLQAFEKAGADVLYAPALTTLDQVRTVTGAVGKPVNVLAPALKGVTLAQLAEAGAKRISIGGALARAAIAAVLRAGREMREHGGFGWTSDLASGGEIKKLLGAWNT